MAASNNEHQVGLADDLPDRGPSLQTRPDILAPAGDREGFLAALAAGADSIYCGLKHFSARMEADNFSTAELADLCSLARTRGCKTYLAFNTLVKPGELTSAGRLLDRIASQVQPEGIIFQDLAVPSLARATGFQGQLHLSTLGNGVSLRGLDHLRSMGISRLVLPRELSIDEIKLVDLHCPEGLDLEVFVHGALCYAVSGRCYWSSFLGGKSGLRGRCVQPCRRLYETGRGSKRFFSCLDLGLDVLTKTLLDLPHIRGWKIEGRKKGPHYVFNTVKAYQLLRDHPQDPRLRKDALELLDHCLGRKTTHSVFLPQRAFNPVDTAVDSGSGRFVGKVSLSKSSRPSLSPRQDLLPGDVLRVGYQDLPGHFISRVSNYIPKGRKLPLPGNRKDLTKGTPVFLIDRREKELQQLIASLESELQAQTASGPVSSGFTPSLPSPVRPLKKRIHLHVRSVLPQGKTPGTQALWLSPGLLKKVTKTLYPKIWFVLPPVIWPEHEDAWAGLVSGLVKSGGRHFVLNALPQKALFPDMARLNLWAGPFCNIANPLALAELKDSGFAGAVISPELEGQSILSLPGSSPLPLGIVLKGFWPLCVSRTLTPELQPGQVLTSPKGERLFIAQRGANIILYPNWELDLSSKQHELEEAGYSLFVHLHEKRPKGAPPPRRTSTLNWDLKLM